MSIKIENTEVFGWKMAIRGARNPMNSWEKSDSQFICPDEGTERWCGEPDIGPNDHKLLMNLCKGGTEESKWRRMVHVQMDVTAPLYWWKEFETYKVGTVSNSCSTMHKIHAKEFTLDDFSWDQLLNTGCDLFVEEKDKGLFARDVQPLNLLTDYIIPSLNICREKFLETKGDDININGTIFMKGERKKYWWQMIQLLPSSYNQKRTIDLNYEVLAAQYRQRKDHKLQEWLDYCNWIKSLPYSEFITMEENNGST